jgi:hypothetical protein
MELKTFKILNRDELTDRDVLIIKCKQESINSTEISHIRQNLTSLFSPATILLLNDNYDITIESNILKITKPDEQ